MSCWVAHNSMCASDIKQGVVAKPQGLWYLGRTRVSSLGEEGRREEIRVLATRMEPGSLWETSSVCIICCAFHAAMLIAGSGSKAAINKWHQGCRTLFPFSGLHANIGCQPRSPWAIWRYLYSLQRLGEECTSGFTPLMLRLL